MFARGVAGFFHYDISLPTVLENDNQAALTLASSPMIGKGVRHADVRTHFFKDAILKGIIQRRARNPFLIFCDDKGLVTLNSGHGIVL
jgi:hypothetical protein